MKAKLNGLVSDLTCRSEICGHLMSRLQDIENMKARIVDMTSFEKEIQKMPELLRGVATALAQRLNAAAPI